MLSSRKTWLRVLGLLIAPSCVTFITSGIANAAKPVVRKPMPLLAPLPSIPYGQTPLYEYPAHAFNPWGPSAAPMPQAVDRCLLVMPNVDAQAVVTIPGAHAMIVVAPRVVGAPAAERR